MDTPFIGFLVLRGTEDIEDVFADALFIPTPEIPRTGGSQLAIGFFDFGRKVVDAAVSHFEENEAAYTGRKLCITGPSFLPITVHC